MTDSPSTSAATVRLPPGVKVGAGIETSQTNGQGQVEQGMKFPVTLANGSTTQIFVPYSRITDAASVQALIDERVNAINAITG